MTAQWDGDEAVEFGSEPKPVEEPPRKPRRRSVPHGNTPRVFAGVTRRQVIREAQGQGVKPPEQWRDELKSGNRDRAAGLLTTKRPTHNSTSGFGLAK